jgi:threonine dehydratase
VSVGIDDARAARERIRALVRPTPVLEAQPAGRDPAPGARLWLKLENLQVTGSFKARGATAKLTTLAPQAVRRGIVTASGGNHGLAVAYAGWIARAPALIYLPQTTPAAKVARFERWGAEVVIEGAVWDEANAAALARAEADGLTYFHPFADPVVIAGQGTVALELFEQVPAPDLLLVAIGGGGLISGIATVAKALHPTLRIIGVEPTGAPTLSESLRRGALVTLPAVPTAAVGADRRGDPGAAPQRADQPRHHRPPGRRHRAGERRRDARGRPLAVARLRHRGRARRRRRGRRADDRTRRGPRRRPRRGAGLRRRRRRDWLARTQGWSFRSNNTECA